MLFVGVIVVIVVIVVVAVRVVRVVLVVSVVIVVIVVLVVLVVCYRWYGKSCCYCGCVVRGIVVMTVPVVSSVSLVCS